MHTASPHYTVLARRFRPQTFSEVVGQEHVAQSLQNAIRSGRVAHAYLFAGARGVGKTSMARILAKALNCPQAQDGVPCNACDICRGISAGSDVDVLEIDGASNRGIDDIRTLRANVGVKSMRTAFKVYIIDEVHMLTKEAFNALLKTLEEPPPSVKFVFCTTEPNKVPDTILSRCQRFDFASIETARIVERLRQIADAEAVAVEPAALELIARRAAGSMRDSQSLFDQLLAFCGERVTAADVHRLLGTAEDDRLIQIVAAAVSREGGELLRHFQEALASGVQLEELFDQLIAYLRDLMVLAAGGDGVPLLSVSPVHRERLGEQARTWGLSTIMAGMEVLAETKSKMFRVPFARALAELALVRLTLLEDLERISEMVQQLQSDRPSVLPGPRSRGGASRDQPQKKSPDGVLEPVAAPSHRPVLEPAADSSRRTDPEPKSRPENRSEEENGTETACRDDPMTAPAVEFRPEQAERFWSEVMSRIVDAARHHVAGVSRAAIVGPNQLVLKFIPSYHFSKKYFEKPENLGRLESLASAVAGQKIRIMVELDSDHPKAAVAAEPAPAARGSVGEPSEDPFVRQALSVFRATVAKVESTRSTPTRED